MSRRLEYFVTPASPYCFLAGPRLVDLAARHGLEVAVLPADMGTVFPATGGLPLGQRSPARRAYRLVELRRWRAMHAPAMNVEPRYFPVADRTAALAIVAAAQAGDDALALANALGRAVWQEERDIAAPGTVAAVAAACGLDGARLLAEAATDAVAAAYAANTERALALGVFGVPWFVWRDEPFWGQDRLDLLERAGSAGA